MNLLLGLVEALRKSPQSFSVTELSNAESELAELKEAGFKLDWLDSRLEEISLERKKLVSDGPWVKKLEEQIKSVELTLSDLKVELEKERIKSIIVSPFSSIKKIPLIITGMVSIVTMFFLIYIYIIAGWFSGIYLCNAPRLCIRCHTDEPRDENSIHESHQQSCEGAEKVSTNSH